MKQPPIIAGLAKLRQYPQNRPQRRAVFAEYQRIFDVLFSTEQRFINSLFDSDFDWCSYSKLYQFYLEQYQKNIKYLEVSLKPEWWEINEQYFVKNFKS